MMVLPTTFCGAMSRNTSASHSASPALTSPNEMKSSASPQSIIFMILDTPAQRWRCDVVTGFLTLLARKQEAEAACRGSADVVPT